MPSYFGSNKIYVWKNQREKAGIIIIAFLHFHKQLGLTDYWFWWGGVGNFLSLFIYNHNATGQTFNTSIDSFSQKADFIPVI
jgi:hypothetical protein